MNTQDIIELGTVSCEELPFDPIEQAKFEADKKANMQFKDADGNIIPWQKMYDEELDKLII